MRPAPEAAALRRPTDRIEDVVAWLLGVAVILGCGFAIFVGLDQFTAALDRSRLETATRTPVVATVAADPQSAAVARGGMPQLRIPAAVTWTAPDGTPGEGTAVVVPGTAEGTAMTIWVTRDGMMIGPPMSPAHAAAAGFVSGLTVLTLDAGLVALAWRATRRVTSAANARAWDREWALMEPQWRNLRR